jgi:hypothetical protein
MDNHGRAHDVEALHLHDVRRKPIPLSDPRFPPPCATVVFPAQPTMTIRPPKPAGVKAPRTEPRPAYDLSCFRRRPVYHAPSTPRITIPGDVVDASLDSSTRHLRFRSHRRSFAG